MTAFLTAISIVALAFLIIGLLNRFRRPDYATIAFHTAQGTHALAGPDLRVVTWNIGYAGLGRDADFFLDGGTSLRPLPKAAIATAAEQIGHTLLDGAWDVMCLQEVPQGGFLTRGVDVRRTLDRRLSGYHHAFWADLKTVFIPPALRLLHGMGTYCAKHIASVRTIELPEAETLMLGFIKKPYAGLLTTLPIAGTNTSWVIINLHLPVYGASESGRRAQITLLFDEAQRAYARGDHVVIAGDLNTRLCDAEFACDQRPDDPMWHTEFPTDSLPAGWSLIADPTTPTIRSLQAPFARGKTFTTIFDGFIVSPNVDVLSVTALDMGFALSDHHPVQAHLTAKT